MMYKLFMVLKPIISLSKPVYEYIDIAAISTWVMIKVISLTNLESLDSIFITASNIVVFLYVSMRTINFALKTYDEYRKRNDKDKT